MNTLRKNLIIAFLGVLSVMVQQSVQAGSFQSILQSPQASLCTAGACVYFAGRLVYRVWIDPSFKNKKEANQWVIYVTNRDRNIAQDDNNQRLAHFWEGSLNNIHDRINREKTESKLFFKKHVSGLLLSGGLFEYLKYNKSKKDRAEKALQKDAN